jgi:L-iditol 2-dehydrogenase
MLHRTAGAAVLEEPGVINVCEFSYPKLPEGGMIVRMAASGVCGTDKHCYRGEAVQYAGTPREFRGPYPSIPGHENVAVIAEIDEEARISLEFYGRELREGDRVVISPDILCGECYWCKHSFGYSLCDNMRAYGNMKSDEPPHLLGGWAEYMVILPGSHIFKLPEGVSDEVGVLAEPMAVTYALDIAKGHSSLPNEGFVSGSNVVVLGVGPLGLCFVIKAGMLGAAQIIATDLSSFRLGMAAEFGADHTLNVQTTTSEERLDLIRQWTRGLGADVVIECTGVPEAFVEGLEILRQGGTFIEVGHFVDRGPVLVNPHRHLCAKNIRLLGMTNLAYIGFMPSIALLQRASDHLDFDKIITHRYSIEEAEAALLKSMELDCMKVVVAPR